MVKKELKLLMNISKDLISDKADYRFKNYTSCVVLGIRLEFKL